MGYKMRVHKKIRKITYPVIRLNPTIPHRLHHTPLLILNIPYPIHLARRDDHVRCPPLDMAIQLLILVDLELGRVMDRAGFAVVEAVFSVDGGVDFREERAFGSAGEAGGGGRRRREIDGRGVGGEDGCPTLDEGCQAQ